MRAARFTAAAASSRTSASPDRSKASIPGRFGRMLYARSVFPNYAQKYAAEGDTRVSMRGSGREDRHAELRR